MISTKRKVSSTFKRETPLDFQERIYPLRALSRCLARRPKGPAPTPFKRNRLTRSPFAEVELRRGDRI